MKEIGPKDLLLGANDTYSFCHEAQIQKDNSNLTCKELFKKTGDKRKWSIINPAMLLASSYSYFVFGFEKKLLANFPCDKEKFLSNFRIAHDNIKDSKTFESSNISEQCAYIKRRLRNSISHCKYKICIDSPDGVIHKDGDVMFIFQDDRDGIEKVTLEISFPNFGNIVEEAGLFVFMN